jgi:hypothetical protein
MLADDPGVAVHPLLGRHCPGPSNDRLPRWRAAAIRSGSQSLATRTCTELSIAFASAATTKALGSSPAVSLRSSRISPSVADQVTGPDSRGRSYWPTPVAASVAFSPVLILMNLRHDVQSGEFRRIERPASVVGSCVRHYLPRRSRESGILLIGRQGGLLRDSEAEEVSV